MLISSGKKNIIAGLTPKWKQFTDNQKKKKLLGPLLAAGPVSFHELTWKCVGCYLVQAAGWAASSSISHFFGRKRVSCYYASFSSLRKIKKKVNLLEFLVRFNSRPPGGSAYSVKCRLKLTFEKNSLTITCVTRRANDVRLKKKHVKQSVCVCVCRIFRRQSKTGDETYDQEAAGPRVAPPTA